MIRSGVIWILFTISVTKMIAVAQKDTLDRHKPEGPTISPSQKEIVLQNGQNFTIKCSGKGPLFLKQQDSPEEIIGHFRMVSRQEPSADPNYEILTLDLYNVDQFAVGYYACFDEMVDGNETLNNLIEEPSDTEHVTYIYVYVNGSNSLFAPMSETLFPASKSVVVIGCRPTAPDIKVTLSVPQSNKTTDFVKFSPKIGFLLRKSRPAYKCNGHRGKETHSKTIHVRYISPPEPKIYGGKEFILGETFSINCTIPYLHNYGVQLNWKYPGSNSTGNIRVVSNEHTPGVNTFVYNNITVFNASKENEGTYFCKSAIVDSKNKSLEKKLVTPYLYWRKTFDKSITTKQDSFSSFFIYNAYPPVTGWSLSKNGKLVELNKEKYIINSTGRSLNVVLKNLTITDIANYTVFVSNKALKNSSTFELKTEVDPVALLLPEVVKCLINESVTLKCVVTGYPLPPVEWDYDTDIVSINNNFTVFESIYNETATLQVSLMDSTNITCIAGSSNVTQTLLVYEVDKGFQIKASDVTWYPENLPFLKQCVASKYDFQKVYWSRNGDIALDNSTEYSENELSYFATLTINQLALNDSGEFRCIGLRINGSKEVQTINITVAETILPVIVDNNIEQDINVFQFQPVQLNCYATAIPLPQIEWQKDDVTLQNMSNVIITTINLNQTTVNSTLDIHQVQENDRGKYVCKATSGKEKQYKTFNVVLKDKPMYKTIITVTIVVIIILFTVMIYLIWKIRKEKQFKRELKAIGLYFFKNGVPKSINPDLFIDEQAELLPYDEKFEFPLDKLSLGKQLGAGAFGVVYKAEARGIIDAEKTTTVAVKMVKKTADNMYIKALASELKIMVHLGKHVNIVNLLGACTKNIARRELIVIVEYCKFGNIHNYLQKHREVFIDQLTDSKENQFGKINRGFSCSSGNSGVQSDYFGSNNTQLTDHTFVNNSASTNRYSRKISESAYVMSEPTYESDCSFLRALCTRDLLCWAFQIARGMEYLASRKVLHGDLAARNILLTEDNVVKICDFGLAKSMYKNDEYLKKGDGLLPVKWLAIECMTDRIFSTQSDVWAFGIVLWELFSLAKTPYPNIRLENVLQWLLEGNRLEKPQHADDRLYDVMRSCWEHKPTLRPTFSQLQEKLGSFLEDNVRNHYIDLNATYIDWNKRSEAQEDYLAMVCAPDYNIMVAPSPHHYVNGNVAQMQLQQDSEGYLQMSPSSTQNIFSPRPQGIKFDFDVKKSNPNTPEVHSNESELTPMLPISRLMPINGSESDTECNLSSSPNPCPRIEEETDDVFENIHNNVKNVNDTSISATNPIYITFNDNCYEKKSQLNNYANVPNGVVS